MDKSKLNFYRATSVIFAVLFVGIVVLNYSFAAWTNPSWPPPSGGAGAIPVTSGGTGATTTADALSNLGAAAKGTNSDIASLLGLTTPLSVAQGGTGAGTLTGVLVGNGTSPVTAPSVLGIGQGGTGLTSVGALNNVLTSNGSAWISQAAPASSGIAFGGTGVDPALNIVSGTTTLNVGGAQVYVMDYPLISITGTAQLTISNPAGNGTILILKSQGACTLTSSASPMINMAGMGSGGDGIGMISGPSAPQSYNLPACPGGYTEFYTEFGGRGINMQSAYIAGVPNVFTGSGGLAGQGTAPNGAGGRGGGGLYIECAGALNFTGSISVAGSNGGNGGTTCAYGYPIIGGAGGAGAANGGTTSWSRSCSTNYWINGSGGGGGGGGSVVILAGSITANTGSITVNGGSRGTPGSSCSGGYGADGGSGYSYVGLKPAK